MRSGHLLVGFMIGQSLLACAGSRRESLVLHPEGLLRVTGTFSSLEVIEGRGVFGAEVRIAVTEEPLRQAVVQFGSGEICQPEDLGEEPCFRASNLMVVNLEFDWSAKSSSGGPVRFTLPSDSPYAGTFEGEILPDRLVGVFSFASGRSLKATMKRGPSHWDG